MSKKLNKNGHVAVYATYITCLINEIYKVNV